MPIDYRKYAADWQLIRNRILTRAGYCCEGSPKYPYCRAENNKPHPATGSLVVLTVAHLDNDSTHNADDNLRAWCQRCHLAYDLKLHVDHSSDTREKKKLFIQPKLF
jgi:5-methylcytosine-specific restriction endonuclease McrA